LHPIAYPAYYLFLLSGISKLTAPTPTIGMIASLGLPFATLGFGVDPGIPTDGFEHSNHGDFNDCQHQ
jgi:hypothetical protein